MTSQPLPGGGHCRAPSDAFSVVSSEGRSLYRLSSAESRASYAETHGWDVQSQPPPPHTSRLSQLGPIDGAIHDNNVFGTIDLGCPDETPYHGQQPSKGPEPLQLDSHGEDQGQMYGSPYTVSSATFSKTRSHDSRSALLPLTPESTASFAKSPKHVESFGNDPYLMNPATPPPWKPRRWPWTWLPHASWFMYLCFLFGVGCAIGHHAYYASLDGQPATDQVQMLRYGTVLAFACKAGLSAAVITAYRQRVWTTVRTRLMSVRALDSLFSATEDFISLWNFEFIRKARTAIALAAFVWSVESRPLWGPPCVMATEELTCS